MKMNLQYYRFLSWAYEDEMLKLYQIEINNDFKERSNDELNDELKHNLFSLIYLTPAQSEIRAFLEYQYEQCKYPKGDFIEFLKNFLSIPPSENFQSLRTEEYLQIRLDDIKDWIEERRNDIKTSNQDGSKKKLLYFYDYLSYSFVDTEPENPENPFNQWYQLICYELKFREHTQSNVDFYIKEVNPLLEDKYYYKLFLGCRPTKCLEFLEYHYKRFCANNPGEEINFLSFIRETITQMRFSKHKNIRDISNDSVRIPLINEWIEKKRSELMAEEPQQPLKKITWNGSPSLFGYIFSELVKNNFIETPVRNGEPNFTGFAKKCWEHFEIDTTMENLIKEMNPKKNSLSDTKRVKFPKLSDLA